MSTNGILFVKMDGGKNIKLLRDGLGCRVFKINSLDQYFVLRKRRLQVIVWRGTERRGMEGARLDFWILHA